MTRPLARSPVERGRRLMENRTRLVPGFISTNPRSTELDSLQQDFPPKSSQFGTCRPTKLDKIKNLHLEIQVSSLTLALG